MFDYFLRPGKSDGLPIEDIEEDVAKERTRVQSEESRDTDVLRVTDLSKVSISIELIHPNVYN